MVLKFEMEVLVHYPIILIRPVHPEIPNIFLNLRNIEEYDEADNIVVLELHPLRGPYKFRFSSLEKKVQFIDLIRVKT
jgi:hypothetical protein